MNPVWSTLEELDTSRAYREAGAGKSQSIFVRIPQLANLRTLLGIDIGELIAFEGRKLVRLSIKADRLHGTTLVSCVARQPGIEVLTVSVEPDAAILVGLAEKARSLRAITTPSRQLVRGDGGWVAR